MWSLWVPVPRYMAMGRFVICGDVPYPTSMGTDVLARMVPQLLRYHFLRVSERGMSLSRVLCSGLESIFPIAREAVWCRTVLVLSAAFHSVFRRDVAYAQNRVHDSVGIFHAESLTGS